MSAKFARCVCNTPTWEPVKFHDDVIKRKHIPHFWPFVQGIHWSPVNSPQKGQWRRALMFFFHLRLSKHFRKQSWGWWFEMPSRSLSYLNNISVPNYCQSVSPKPTTLDEDWELFLNFSSILCLWFEIQGRRTDNFFDWVFNTDNITTI